MQHLQKEKYEAPALAALEIVWPVAAVLMSIYALLCRDVATAVVSPLVWLQCAVLRVHCKNICISTDILWRVSIF